VRVLLSCFFGPFLPSSQSDGEGSGKNKTISDFRFPPSCFMAESQPLLTGGPFSSKPVLSVSTSSSPQATVRSSVSTFDADNVSVSNGDREAENEDAEELQEEEEGYDLRHELLTAEKHRKLPLKARIYQTFENPRFSLLARVLNAYILLLIFGSTVAFCLQSVYSLAHTTEQEAIWFAVEIFIVVNFTLEYLIRMVTCPKLWPFLISPLNIIDLVAILPFYIGLIVQSNNLGGLAAARVLRLVRIFRVLKLGKSVEVINMLGTAFHRSRQGILVLLFLIGLAMVFFSSFMYYAETSICELNESGVWIYTSGSREGEATYYQNIIASFWWAIVTLTTVGYGDTYPTSGAGKFVASLAMVTGILVLAFPITIISVHLTETYGEFQERKKARARHARALEKVKSFEGKSNAELVTLLTTYQERISDFSSSIAEKMREVNERMEDMAVEQKNAEALLFQLKKVLDGAA